MVTVDLVAAAFGDEPVALPIPAARSMRESWLRGVALGARGCYASAEAALEENLRRRVNPVMPVERRSITSLSYSTGASLWRQRGQYARAAALDACALRLITESFTNDGDARIAWCDAITGLAADSIGAGRLAVAGRLLDRLDGSLRRWDGAGNDNGFWRQHIRRDWVRCELALYSQDPSAGRLSAESAVRRAQASPSARHRIKSQLMLAASLQASGEAASRSSNLAWHCLRASQAMGLYPLAWAATRLLHGDPKADELRDEFERVLHRRGGVFA